MKTSEVALQDCRCAKITSTWIYMWVSFVVGPMTSCTADAVNAENVSVQDLTFNNKTTLWQSARRGRQSGNPVRNRAVEYVRAMA